MVLKLVETLSEAMQVRLLRNSCSQYLTNHRDQISKLQQLRWYFKYYRNAFRTGRYRLYLANVDGSPVGYGALSLEDGKLLVTECVGAEYRGRGYGTSILDGLIRIASKERRDVVAEIWTSNEPSVALHEKAGFQLDSTRIKSGQEIRTYVVSRRPAGKSSGSDDRGIIVAQG